MSKSWLLCVLLGTLAWGQAAPSVTPPGRANAGPVESAAIPPQAAPDMSASVPANAAVITVEGVCPPQPKPAAAAAGAGAKTATKTAAAKPADCKTVITKAEFEKLASSVAPTVTPQLKKQLASVLPRLIALSAQARKEHLDQTEQYKETLKFVQMQVLTTQLQREVQKQASEVPEAEVEKYYKDNPEAYEQFSLDRLFVPRTKQGANDSKPEEEKDQKMTEEQEKAKQAADKAKADEAEAAMTKLAIELRARAAKGEDFTKLQKEAFEAAGMKVESPNVALPSVRRTGLPSGHAAVFDLKPGDVSEVISDAGGHYIYKVNSKTVMPLEQVKTEIHNKLQGDRMREKMDALNNSFKATTNDAYFGPATVGGPVAPHPRPGMPGAGPRSSPPASQPPAAQPN